MLRYSTLLVLILDKSEKTLKYQVLDQPGTKNHIMIADSPFQYNKIQNGMTYVIKCVNHGAVWEWLAAYPVDISKVIK